MKKYAVVKIAGLQYKVAEGEEIAVNNLNQEKGKELVLEEILLLAEDDKIKIGQPFIKEAKIKAKVIEEFNLCPNWRAILDNNKSKKTLKMWKIKYR
jgi:ribosomal protein L21